MTGRDREGEVLHPASDPSDRRGVLTLVGIGTVATNVLMLCLWSWWAFGTHNGFADMSVDMLKDRYVRGVVADQIVDALEQQAMTEQMAVAIGPVLKPVVAEIVNTDAFKGLFYAGARQLHETIFLGARSRMLVQVDDAGQMVKESLGVVNPELADTIPDTALDIAVGLSQDRRLDTVVRTASYTGWMLWPLGAVALGSFATALIRSRDPRRTVLRIGVALMVSGLFWIVVLIVGVAVVSRMVDGPDDRAALASRVPVDDSCVHAHRPRGVERRHRDHRSRRWSPARSGSARRSARRSSGRRPSGACRRCTGSSVR